MKLFITTGILLSLVFSLFIGTNLTYAKQSGLKFSGTISVPEASYWNYVNVGVITISKNDDSSKIKTLLRETSKGLKIIGNLYYFNPSKKGGVSFDVEKGSISGNNPVKRNFEVSLPLPTNPANSYYIVAFYDANKNGKWDVENANNYFGVSGSEAIQLPILPKFNYSNKDRIDCVIGNFKRQNTNGYYFAFMSGEPNALSTTYAVFNKNLSNASFDFSGKTATITSGTTETPSKPTTTTNLNPVTEKKTDEPAVTKPIINRSTGSIQQQAADAVAEATKLMNEKKAKNSRNASYKIAVRNLNTAKAALRTKKYADAKRLADNAINLFMKLK